MDVDKVCSWFFSADRKIIQTSAASNISASPLTGLMMRHLFKEVAQCATVQCGNDEGYNVFCCLKTCSGKIYFNFNFAFIKVPSNCLEIPTIMFVKRVFVSSHCVSLHCVVQNLL